VHDSPPASSPDRRITFFDQLAERWDVVGQNPEETVRQVAQLASRLALSRGETVLEVGCGTGQLTGWLAEQVAPGRVLAIDFAPAMIAAARAKQIAAEFRTADICRDDLGEGFVDLALCFHSFPHFRDQATALQNMARTLKPTGRLIVLHLAGSAQINAFHDQVGGAVAGDHLPTQSQWPSLLQGAGLRATETVDREGLFFLKAVPNVS